MDGAAVKTESVATAGEVCWRDAGATVKVEVDIGPTVLQQVDLRYSPLPIKFERDEDKSDESAALLDADPLACSASGSRTTGTLAPVERALCVKAEFVEVEARVQATVDTHKKLKRSSNYSKTIILPSEAPPSQATSAKPGFRQQAVVGLNRNICMLCSNSFDINHKCKAKCKSSRATIDTKARHDAPPRKNKYYPRIRLKIFKCSLCNFSGYDNNALTRHTRLHTGEKPYECAVCKYKCAERSNLIQHIQTHSGERPHKCTLCHYKFTTKSSLKKHLVVHSGIKPYECSLCKSKFARKAHWQRHLQTHSEGKLYECSLCEFKYPLKSDLKSHLRVHRGEKPHE